MNSSFCLLRPAAIVMALCLGLSAGAAEPKAAAKRKLPNPAMQPVKDDPALPRVLLIGDSISIGYTVPVRQRLQGKANVHRPLTNCAHTRTGLERLDAWLGDGKWDVIHFNWGLHDLKYADAKGTMVDVKAGQQLIPVEEYRKNLAKLVERLKKTGARLIWCSTTPVPEGAQGRLPADVARYNEAARSVMQEAGVAVDDLEAFAAARLDKIQLKANVHFTPAGYEELASQVAAAIEPALK